MQDSQQFSHPLKFAFMISNCHPDPSIFCTLSCPLSGSWIMASRGLLNDPSGVWSLREDHQNCKTLAPKKGPLVCPLNHLTLFPSQYSHVFLNKINIWLIHTVGAALSSGQKRHYQNTGERGAFTRCSVCTSPIRRDLEFVTVTEFELHILNKTSNIDLKPQSQSLYFDSLLIQIKSLQITSQHPETMPGTCPLEICWPKDHLIMK